MKANRIILGALILLPLIRAIGQDIVLPKTKDTKKSQLTVPETQPNTALPAIKMLTSLKQIR
jgi:hypothetical protein